MTENQNNLDSSDDARELDGTQKEIEGVGKVVKDEVFNEQKKERRIKLIGFAIILFIGIGLGLTIGFNWLYIIGLSTYLTAILTTLIFIVGALAYLLLVYKDRILYKLFGVAKASNEEIFSSFFPSITTLYKKLAHKTESKEVDESMSGLEKGGRQILAYFAFRRTRTFILSLFFSLLLGLFGMVGTMLLLKQNELIKEQSHLIEGQRRSSLIFMLANIMDTIDESLAEAKDIDYHPSRIVNKVTIARLAALSQSMKPIRYLEGNSLIENSLSPERGQLLLSLVNCKFDTTKNTIGTVLNKCSFQQADLKHSFLEDVILQNAKLYQADLYNSNWIRVVIDSCVFYDANLASVTFYDNTFKNGFFTSLNIENGFITDSGFYNTSLSRNDFSNARVEYSEFINSTLHNENYTGSHLSNVVFEKCKLVNVNFSNAVLTNVRFKDILEFSSISFDSTLVQNRFFLDDIRAEIELNIAEQKESLNNDSIVGIPSKAEDLLRIENLESSLKEFKELQIKYKIEKVSELGLQYIITKK